MSLAKLHVFASHPDAETCPRTVCFRPSILGSPHSLRSFGLPRIELGLYPPHGYVLPVYYTPTLRFSPAWIRTTGIHTFE